MSASRYDVIMTMISEE